MGLSFPSVLWWEEAFRVPSGSRVLGRVLKSRKCFLILPNPAAHAHRTLPRCPWSSWSPRGCYCFLFVLRVETREGKDSLWQGTGEPQLGVE